MGFRKSFEITNALKIFILLYPEQFPIPKERKPALKHDPEKWVPGFRKRSCSSNKLKRDHDSKKSHHALVLRMRSPIAGSVDFVPLTGKVFRRHHELKCIDSRWRGSLTGRVRCRLFRYEVEHSNENGGGRDYDRDTSILAHFFSQAERVSSARIGFDLERPGHPAKPALFRTTLGRVALGRLLFAKIRSRSAFSICA